MKSSLALALTFTACGVATPPEFQLITPVADPVLTDAQPVDTPVAKPRASALSLLRSARLQDPVLSRRPQAGPTVHLPGTMHIPDLGANARFSMSGAASTIGAAVAGSAGFFGAPVVDPDGALPAAWGGGFVAIDVGGTTYASCGSQSFGYTFDDGTTNYLVLGTGWAEIDPITGAEIASVVYVITPAADFAVGAQIALDGIDRVAIFFHGDTSLDPQVAAVAETGFVSFTAGGTAIGSLVDASVDGDFVEVQVATQPSPQPGPGVSAGTYDLAYVPQAYVYCEGSLAGQEASFETLLPSDLGLADGVVSLATGAGGIDINGAVGFGASLALQSDPSAPPGIFYGIVNGSGAGPVSTSLVALYFAVDELNASALNVPAFAGAAFENATGFCQVDFEASLTP